MPVANDREYQTWVESKNPFLFPPQGSAAGRSRFLPEVIFSIVCAAVLGAQLLHYSPLKPLWNDEILTYYQVAGKSPGAAIASLDTGFNLLPPGYFALLAAVLQFVEFSPLIARGLSCGFIMATIPVMLFALRGQVGRWFAMAAVSGVTFSSPLIFFHNSEARPYGMSLFITALVGLAFLRSSEVRTPATHTLVLLVVANALVATTNYFGGIYSASALAVTIFCDWRMRWFRPRVYGAYLVGWAIFSVTVLPITFQQLAARGDAGTQWLPSFGSAWRQLTKQWAVTAWWVLPLLVALGLLLWAARIRSRGVHELQPPLPQPFQRLAILSAVWMILPVGFILQSLVTDRNLYFNRYFIGSDLGLMILAASLLALLCRKLSGSLSLDNVTALRPKFLLLARALVVAFMVTTALMFLTHDGPGSNRRTRSGGAR